jgi:hypothetical protein
MTSIRDNCRVENLRSEVVDLDSPYHELLGRSAHAKFMASTHVAYLNMKISGVGDIPNRYTSDVVLNQQARVAHQGGMADCLPGGPVAGSTWRILDAGAHGGSGDRPMADCLVVHA